jgi:plastocyanin
MGVSRAAIAWIAAVVISIGMLALPVVVLAANQSVAISGFMFQPNSVTVRVGEVVTWTNNDGVPHSATANNGAWNTGTFASGSRAITFGAAGTFGYHCSVHTAMTGTVVVQAAATPQPTPPPPPPPTPRPTPPPAPLPTPVRTAPPTPVPTIAPTPATTVAPTPDPTTAPPSPTASPTPTALQTLALASPTATTVAAQITAAPVPAEGAGPVLIAAAAVAVAALGALAWVLMRRT